MQLEAIEQLICGYVFIFIIGFHLYTHYLYFMVKLIPNNIFRMFYIFITFVGIKSNRIDHCLLSGGCWMKSWYFFIRSQFSQ